MSSYYCLVINSSAYHGNTEKVVKEIKSIIQNQSKQITVVNNKELVNTGEYFIFVEGKQALAKMNELVKLSGVLRVVSVGDTPYGFSEKELSGFTTSIEKKETIEKFKKGDIVYIKDGCYKNLFGLVMRNKKGGLVEVLMKFHVRNFRVCFEHKTIRREKSIYDFKPTNIDNKDWFEKFA